MEKHEFNFFPEAYGDDKQSLIDSIKENGFDKDFPVLIFEDKILDGWNRYLACKELGVNPYTKQFVGDRQSALDYSIRANLDRRHLSSSQRAMMAVRANELVEAIRNKVVKLSRTKKEARPENPKERTTDAIIGKTFGVSSEQIRKAKIVSEENPQEVKKILNGETSVNKAFLATKPRPSEDKDSKPKPSNSPSKFGVIKFGRWKTGDGGEKQEYKAGDEAELIRFAYAQLSEIGRALKYCSGSYQSEAMNTFINKTFPEISQKLKTWIEKPFTCHKCVGSGKVDKAICSHCGGEGNIGHV